ncbi:hypothetical protein BH20ACI4_BH20ACI4_07870 [soil metagenome]
MTDNLSNNAQTRIFETESPAKLKADYERQPEIENQIKEVLQISKTELAARLAIENFRSPDYLKGEILVCLLDLARVENQPLIYDSVADKLARIGNKIIRKLLRGKGFDENFVEEAVGEIIVEMFVQILGRAEKSYDFWEVCFYNSLEKLTNNYLRKHGAKAKSTDTFSDLSNAENENEFDFESNLPNFENLTIEKRFEVKEILTKLSEEDRKIFIFFHAGDWTQAEIAQFFGVTARTIRNRLTQIDEFLKDFRPERENEN